MEIVGLHQCRTSSLAGLTFYSVTAHGRQATGIKQPECSAPIPGNAGIFQKYVFEKKFNTFPLQE